MGLRNCKMFLTDDQQQKFVGAGGIRMSPNQAISTVSCHHAWGSIKVPERYTNTACTARPTAVRKDRKALYVLRAWTSVSCKI